MNKALILTFHYARNYGAVLQTYALYHTLKKYFDAVGVLNYINPEVAMPYRLPGRTWRQAISTAYNLLTIRKCYRKFDEFVQENLSLLGQATSRVEDLPVENATHIFIGSDQIWNPDITHGIDEVYFGNFSRSSGCKRIAYAASLGSKSVRKSVVEDIAHHIGALDRISVREKSAKALLQPLTTKPIEVVLDPTLLLTADEWRSIAEVPSRRGYVLLYRLAGYDETYRIAQTIAEERQLELVEIVTGRKSLRKVYRHTVIATAGPKEFLGLLMNADFVATDSFHGTVFSLIFEKDFITVPHKTTGARMRDLLETVGLAERLRSEVDEVKSMFSIDWASARDSLARERCHSLAYIESSI